MQVVERGGEVLLVSQFTLFTRTAKKSPDFSRAMPTAEVRQCLKVVSGVRLRGTAGRAEAV